MTMNVSIVSGASAHLPKQLASTSQHLLPLSNCLILSEIQPLVYTPDNIVLTMGQCEIWNKQLAPRSVSKFNGSLSKILHSVVVVLPVYYCGCFYIAMLCHVCDTLSYHYHIIIISSYHSIVLL